MQTPGEIRRELPADLDDAEREMLVRVAMRLHGGRPTPALEFREGLRRELVGESRWRRSAGQARPREARDLAAAYCAAGVLMLAVAAAGLAGAGPFA